MKTGSKKNISKRRLQELLEMCSSLMGRVFSEHLEDFKKSGNLEKLALARNCLDQERAIIGEFERYCGRSPDGDYLGFYIACLAGSESRLARIVAAVQPQSEC
jgi:hypothetical protein